MTWKIHFVGGIHCCVPRLKFFSHIIRRCIVPNNSQGLTIHGSDRNCACHLKPFSIQSVGVCFLFWNFVSVSWTTSQIPFPSRAAIVQSDHREKSPLSTPLKFQRKLCHETYPCQLRYFHIFHWSNFSQCYHVKHRGSTFVLMSPFPYCPSNKNILS